MQYVLYLHTESLILGQCPYYWTGAIIGNDLISVSLTAETCGQMGRGNIEKLQNITAVPSGSKIYQMIEYPTRIT